MDKSQDVAAYAKEILDLPTVVKAGLLFEALKVVEDDYKAPEEKKKARRLARSLAVIIASELHDG